MILCGGSDSGEYKSPEHDFKYLYWTISKIFFWNLFACEGTYIIDWVGRCHMCDIHVCHTWSVLPLCVCDIHMICDIHMSDIHMMICDIDMRHIATMYVTYTCHIHTIDYNDHTRHMSHTCMWHTCMWHTCMSHTVYVTYTWRILPRGKISCHVHVCHVTYKWVMSHTFAYTSVKPRTNESCHIHMSRVTYTGVMSQVTWLRCTWHDAYVCDMTHLYVVSHFCMRHDSFSGPFAERDLQFCHPVVHITSECRQTQFQALWNQLEAGAMGWLRLVGSWKL